LGRWGQVANGSPFVRATTIRNRAVHGAVVALFLAAPLAAINFSATAGETPATPDRRTEQSSAPLQPAEGKKQALPHDSMVTGIVTRLTALDRKIAGFQTKLKNSPNLWPVWGELGSAYLSKARLSGSLADQMKAEGALARSLAIQANAVAWRWLAAIRLDQHRFPEAATLARRAVEAWKADGISRAILSDALLAMARYEEARAVFGDQPRDFYSIVGRSRLLFLTGEPHEAIAQLGQALATLGAKALAPVVAAKAWCHLMIGSYYYEMDQPSQAKEAYSHALALDPHRIDVLEHVAEWEAKFGSREAAVKMYRNIIAAVPRPQEKYALGVLLINIGLSYEGKALINEAVVSWQKRLEHGDVSVRRQLALAILDHGKDVQRALSLARADLNTRRDALAYDTLAWALYKAGAREEAKRALARALRHGTPLKILRLHAEAINRL